MNAGNHCSHVIKCIWPLIFKFNGNYVSHSFWDAKNTSSLKLDPEERIANSVTTHFPLFQSNPRRSMNV